MFHYVINGTMIRNLPLVTVILLLLLITVKASESTSDVQSNTTLLRGLQSPTSRIVGGYVANVQRYPYFTYLRVTTSDGRYQCGGTLIAMDVVMTAGHCYQDLVAQGIEVLEIEAVVNMTQRSLRTGYEYPRTVTDIMVHPSYDNDNTENDVMLLLLNQAVPQVPTPVLSTPAVDPLPGTAVTTIGFGLLKENGSISRELYSVDINIISQDDCNDSDSYAGYVNEQNMICAGVEGGGKDACAGDSGGPLVELGDYPEEDLIVGITSFGSGCARPEKYGVYTRVSAFDQFISKGVCKLSKHAPPICNEEQSPTPVPAGISLRPPTLLPNAIPTSLPTNKPTPFPTSKPTLSPMMPYTIEPVVPPTLAPFILPGIPGQSGCITSGRECQMDSDCCSLRCLDTNNAIIGNRCFGPRAGTSKGSNVRLGNGMGGNGGRNG
jgi:hypothetical protein